MINIFQQPQNITYYSGSPYKLSVSAITDIPDTELKYSWKSSVDGVVWVDVVDPTASTDKLTVMPTNISYENTFYKVVIREVDSNTSSEISTVDSEQAKAISFDGRTAAPPTRARDGSKVRSRKANDLEFVLEQSLDALSVNGNIGYATIQDAMRHVPYPTIQNSIMDAATVGRHNINDVVINTSNTDPSGKPQIDTLTFSGVVTSGIVGAPVTFDVFGSRLTVPDATSATEFRDKVMDLLSDFEAAGLYVKDVTAVGADAINFSYKDMRDHTPAPWSANGIDISWTIGSPAIYGYGYWELLATESKATTGGGTVTLYYWRRIG